MLPIESADLLSVLRINRRRSMTRRGVRKFIEIIPLEKHGHLGTLWEHKMERTLFTRESLKKWSVCYTKYYVKWEFGRENNQFDYFDGVPHGRKNFTDCNKWNVKDRLFLCEEQRINNSLLNILRKDTSCQILKIFPSSCSNNGQMILKIENLLSKIY